ncbi:DUF368 domain-containing protein [Cellulomonas carbonis]|uniref:DUF368 domain-containing protein n=1 Tax=Cellulomonas carbonis T26 TaxID=947969 RepID=A0A0A0BTH0_9CELL|nr:DUF368 domain-containing protein [Cellulomonas carbonis]KGM10474.1 hypothetical protein N868_15275 [Cellulomonas carbonis T26]GGC04737.1 DUF368 domain-containing protein [Cellulomonas carbonis]
MTTNRTNRPTGPADDEPDAVAPHHAPPRGWGERLGLVGRGALIGAAEIVPGVSGGTIALLVGVYETLIRSAGHLVRGVATSLARLGGRRDPGAARHHLRQVRWGAVLPIGLGMVTAVVLGARLLEPVLEDHPTGARAVFAGLILASLVVPARMVGGRWTPGEVLVGLLAAAAAFALTGIPPAAEQEPSPLVVAAAAAVAVCALVLPGISGSFLLLTLGLYQPTIAAVNDRDLGYLGVFALGAVLGLSVFVSGLQWLLEHRHRITLVVMTGLMAGSLRALWPWQDDERGLLAPGDDVGLVVALVVAGAAVVGALLVLEARAERAAAPVGRHEAADEPSV